MQLLPPKFVEKPWGCDSLPLRFGETGDRRIGEIWFEPPPDLGRLLVKYLFTSEKVSVQVHPDDAQAVRLGNGVSGKDECWFVVAAEEGAALGIGFERELDEQELRAASIEGRIDELLVWHPVAAGDFFYLPANHVHAIGAGLTLLEVQQKSDIAYRLYDYDRGRDLDLDKGVAVANRGPYPDHLHRNVPSDGHVSLVDGPHFRLDRVASDIPEAVAEAYARGPLMAACLFGTTGIGGSSISPGQCAVVEDVREIRQSGGGSCLLAQPL